MTDEEVFELIKARLVHARKEHPEGTNLFDIESEWDEWEKEDMGSDGEIYEAVDLIVTIIRYSLLDGDWR